MATILYQLQKWIMPYGYKQNKDLWNEKKLQHSILLQLATSLFRHNPPFPRTPGKWEFRFIMLGWLPNANLWHILLFPNVCLHIYFFVLLLLDCSTIWIFERHFTLTIHYVYEWWKFDLEHFDQMKVFLFCMMLLE
jgi:hypothetical protein